MRARTGMKEVGAKRVYRPVGRGVDARRPWACPGSAHGALDGDLQVLHILGRAVVQHHKIHCL